uniref:hypothetical protein n=1 Tax=Altererythrobacter segetis TaxID=1104773 RepID=UPI00140A08E1|nr:hypothetical protein [Altererythrobacter segetis]
MNVLRLSYHPEDERHGELSASVETGEFRGVGSAWFKIEQLREFLRLITAYPLSEGQEPNLEGGFYDETGARLEQRHLSIRLAAHDPLGSVRVTVCVATQASRDEERDLRNP